MTAAQMLAAVRAVIAECEKRSVNSAHRRTKLENDMSWCAINVKADVGRAIDEIEEMVALEEEIEECEESNFNRSYECQCPQCQGLDDGPTSRKFNEDGEER